jgi:hypothetical protein
VNAKNKKSKVDCDDIFDEMLLKKWALDGKYRRRFNNTKAATHANTPESPWKKTAREINMNIKHQAREDHFCFHMLCNIYEGILSFYNLKIQKYWYKGNEIGKKKCSLKTRHMSVNAGYW